MIDQLFGSKTRVKLLSLFLSNVGRPFYVREITRKIDEQINSVRRELSNLLSIGIISSETSNNKLFYQLNEQYEHFDALKKIFSNHTSATTKDIDDQTKPYYDLGSVKIAYLMGSFVRDKSQLIDLFIVGDISKPKLNKVIKDLEKEKGGEVNYSVMLEKEYRYRKQLNDRFIHSIESSKKSVLIDEYNN